MDTVNRALHFSNEQRRALKALVRRDIIATAVRFGSRPFSADELARSVEGIAAVENYKDARSQFGVVQGHLRELTEEGAFVIHRLRPRLYQWREDARVTHLSDLHKSIRESEQSHRRFGT